MLARLGWPVDVHPLPPLLHNHPERIPERVRERVLQLRERYSHVAIGYADCGTYGGIDAVCDELGVRRLPGLHCYDIYAGARRIEQLLDDQPGTYLLTDFLVQSFARSVVRELGLDRWPELRADYFGAYTRAVWLSQEPDPELHRLAVAAASRMGLPLEVIHTGESGLAEALSHAFGAEVA